MERQTAQCVAGEKAPALESPALDLLRRWLELSELERRAFLALARELADSSELVERSTLVLSEKFQNLAGIAQDQVGRVDRIIAAASALIVEGEPIALDAALQFVESTLGKANDLILFVSKNAMRMVFTLEEVSKDVAAAQACSAQIETINRQAGYLALNAAIEAARSGPAGAAFKVIANEMKQLSMSTQATSVTVRERYESVMRGVQRGRQVLQEIATMDLSENILARQRIDALLGGIATQHEVFGTVLGETASASDYMAATVGQMITGMQFQDRNKQTVAQVIETLNVLAASTASVQQATSASFPGMFEPGGIDQAALARVIEKQTLGAVKSRILARLLTGESGAESEPEGEAESGDVELF
jgi:methyl-accepting chemotaxis protein